METLRAPIKSPSWRSRVCDAQEVACGCLSAACVLVAESLLLEWPVTSISLSAVVCLALATCGFKNVDIRYRIEETLISSDFDSRRNSAVVNHLFPSTPRFSRLLVTSLENGSHNDSSTSNSINSSDGDDVHDQGVITIAAFEEIWDVAQQVAAIEVGPGNDTYETLCYREAGECAPYGVLSVWGGDESLYRATVADDESLRMALSASTYLDGSPVQRDMIFGDFEMETDGRSGEQLVAYARGVIVAYALASNGTNVAELLEWERAFLDVAAGADLTTCKIFRDAEFSSEAEEKAGAESGTALAGMSLLSMAVASSLLLGDFPRLGVPLTHTRISLGLIGVGLLLLSCVAAIAALSLGGVPVGGVYMPLIPVVCVSVGLKNVFGICAELDDAHCELPAWDRLRGAAGRWVSGSAFVALVACVVLGVVAGFASAPAMGWFCSYAAAGIATGWFIQIFALIPALYLDELRRDSGRFDLACCFESAMPAQDPVLINTQSVRPRRDSFVVESSPEHRKASPGHGEEAKNGNTTVSALWGDDGDDRRSRRTQITKASAPRKTQIRTMVVVNPPVLNSPPTSTGYDTASLIIAGSPLGSPNSNNAQPLHGGNSRYSGWGAGRSGGKGKRRHVWSKSAIERFFKREKSVGNDQHSRRFSPDPSKETIGAHARTHQSQRVTKQRMPHVNGEMGNREGGGGVVRIRQRAPRRMGRGGGGLGECCFGASALVQGYCNWLVDDGDWTKYVVLAAFGALLMGSLAVCFTRASPGYNAINFYSSSSYVGDYVSTARGMGVLFGESSLPVAAYVTGVDLSLAANQRAVLDLETALISSSTDTVSIASTTRDGGGLTTAEQAPSSPLSSSVSSAILTRVSSSWLRGLLAWIPSSRFASSLSDLDSLDGSNTDNSSSNGGLWAGTTELFDDALEEFLGEPGNQRFKSDLSFTHRRAIACRVWVRHVDFVGSKAETTMNAAKHAATTTELEPYPFVFAREYSYAEHFESVTWDLIRVILASAATTTFVGYLFLGRHALVGILVVATLVVQVDTLAVGLLTGEGLNVYSISPSLLIATALGAGWTGTCLASFAGQDPERSFEVNVRISIAATAGPLCSAAAVLIVGTVPLLLAGGGYPHGGYGTKFLRTAAGIILWASLLSLSHALVFTPALVLVCGEKVTMGAREVTPAFRAEEDRVDYLPYALREYDVEFQGDGFAIAIGGNGRAAAVLSDEEDLIYGEADNDGSISDDDNHYGKRHPNGKKAVKFPGCQTKSDSSDDGNGRKHQQRKRALSRPRALSPGDMAWGALGAREAMSAAFSRDEAVYEAGRGRGEGEKEDGGGKGTRFAETMGVRMLAARNRGVLRPRSSSWGDE